MVLLQWNAGDLAHKITLTLFYSTWKTGKCVDFIIYDYTKMFVVFFDRVSRLKDEAELNMTNTAQNQSLQTHKQLCEAILSHSGALS